MFVLYVPELPMNVQEVAAWAILALIMALPIAGLFFVPKLAGFLKAKGLDDETLAFIDLVDDYFDEAEDWADATGVKGAGKLTRVLTGLVEKLERELTAAEKAQVEARTARRATALKGAIKRYKDQGLSSP